MSSRHDYAHGKKRMPLRKAVVSPRRFGHGSALSQRKRGAEKNERHAFAPPEDWYEPSEEECSYSVVVQPPGSGYRHIVTPDEIRDRLEQLPSQMVRPLEVIQLSRMTRKKQSFPCYGMQWGTTLYLYPIEEDLVEYYARPPKPAHMNEARMYGGRWTENASGEWQLVWTEAAVKDFYLNNILIHELGHLLDDRNTSYADRERYAEWFAIEHGYKRSQRRFSKSRPSRDRVSRRHHAV
jgi:hypothetical protein